MLHCRRSQKSQRNCVNHRSKQKYERKYAAMHLPARETYNRLLWLIQINFFKAFDTFSLCSTILYLVSIILVVAQLFNKWPKYFMWMNLMTQKRADTVFFEVFPIWRKFYELSFFELRSGRNVFISISKDLVRTSAEQWSSSYTLCLTPVFELSVVI